MKRCGLVRTRILEGISPFESDDLRIILSNAVALRTNRELTKSDIMRWLDCSRKQAKHIYEIVSDMRLVRTDYSLNPSKLGLTRILEKTKSIKLDATELVLGVRDLDDKSENFLIMKLTESRSREKGLMNEAKYLNTKNYDVTEKKWTLKKESSRGISKKELLSFAVSSVIQKIGSDVNVSKRDKLISAILCSVPDFNGIKQNLTESLGIPMKEIELSYRNVIRRKLVTSSQILSFPELNKLVCIILSGKSNDVISTLAVIVKSVPRAVFRLNDSWDYGLVWVGLPIYLVSQFLNFLQPFRDESKTIDSVYMLQSFKRYTLSSVLSLL